MRFLSLLLLLSAGTLAWADKLFMKDGRVVIGTYLGGNARTIRMDLGNQVGSYDVGDVARIEFQTPAASAPPPPPPQAPPPPAAPPEERPRILRPVQSEAPPMMPSITIPAGTALKVRMIDSVDSETSQLGQTFQASLDDPIVIDGQTVVPRGADVVAKLVEDRQSGKISGRTELTLDLASIRINGRLVDVVTGEVTSSSGSRGGKTAKVVGGGAVLGAVLGGIFGGGKGAAIGAASGAGAGGAVQVMTKGQRVKIPSETRLSFTLQNDLRI